MARKPNYRFERHERERIKAAKKAARAEAKAAKKVKPGEAGEGEADEAATGRGRGVRRLAGRMDPEDRARRSVRTAAGSTRAVQCVMPRDGEQQGSRRARSPAAASSDGCDLPVWRVMR